MSRAVPPPDRLPGSDLRLSKYNPLPRILFFDDFDEGMNGWCEYRTQSAVPMKNTIRP